MNTFDVHNQRTAPAGSSSVLSDIEKSMGFIPNLLGVFAESPATLKAYMTISKIFDESSFSPTERQVVLLAASRFNGCHYCVAAHSAIAEMQNVPVEVVESIRNDRPIADARLQALRDFTTTVVEKRGWVSDDEIARFIEAGFSKAQVLEVILGVSVKILSNYTNHVADTPVDDAFASRAWQPHEQEPNDPAGRQVA